MHAADLLILALLALVVLLALRGARRSRAKGCGGCCAACGRSCANAPAGKAVDKAEYGDYNKSDN